MTLKDYIKHEAKFNEQSKKAVMQEIAHAMGVKSWFSLYRYFPGRRIPDREKMLKLYNHTLGEVGPMDFYDCE